MIDLNDIQQRIIAYRRARGFASLHQLDKTSLGLLEEAGEFEKARRKDDYDKMVNALGDVIIFCLGGLAILDKNSEDVISQIVSENEHRENQIPH